MFGWGYFRCRWPLQEPYEYLAEGRSRRIYRIVLVGHCIFDNAAQVGGEPDTITQLAVQLLSA